jgi:hypothetical protein
LVAVFGMPRKILYFGLQYKTDQRPKGFPKLYALSDHMVRAD